LIAATCSSIAFGLSSTSMSTKRKKSTRDAAKGEKKPDDGNLSDEELSQVTGGVGKVEAGSENVRRVKAEL
jgi:bacteriocin-like protein